MSNTTLEQVLQQARALPPDERRKLREALDAADLSLSARETYNPRELEMKWLTLHCEEYAGRWVAVEGDRLVAEGDNARAVYEAARAAGIEIPFVTRVEPRQEAFMGGWL